MRRFRFLTAAFFTLATVAPANAGAYSDWAAIVVAGDWHAHDGSPSEAFDNARRDVTAGLEHIGFSRVNIVQFSVRPQRYPRRPPNRPMPRISATRCGTSRIGPVPDA